MWKLLLSVVVLATSGLWLNLCLFVLLAGHAHMATTALRWTTKLDWRLIQFHLNAKHFEQKVFGQWDKL